MLTRENVTTDDVLRIYVLRLMNTTTRHGRLYSQLGPPNNFDFATAGPTAQVRPPLALIYIERSPPRCPPIYLSVLCQLPYTTHESNLHSIQAPRKHPSSQAAQVLSPFVPVISPSLAPLYSQQFHPQMMLPKRGHRFFKFRAVLLCPSPMPVKFVI